MESRGGSVGAEEKKSRLLDHCLSVGKTNQFLRWRLNCQGPPTLFFVMILARTEQPLMQSVQISLEKRNRVEVFLAD